MNMTNEDLIKLGFKELPHFTVGNQIFYDLGYRKELSVACIGTPNEMVFLCERTQEVPSIMNECICIHNWDYHGYLTLEKIEGIIKFLTIKNK